MTDLPRLALAVVMTAAFTGMPAVDSRPVGPAPEFGDPMVLPTGQSPYFVAAADLNRDGAVDLVTSNTISHSVTVFINTGNGTFAGGVSYATHGLTPYALAVGDLNGDGALDIVCGNMFSVTFSIFFNNGDGTFQDARTLTSEPGAMFPVIADLDGDGHPDVAFCNIGHDNVSVYGNDGKGNLTHRGTFRTNGVIPYSMVAADFDGDGRLDLATGNIYSANLSVLRGLGNFAFAEPVTYKTDSLTQILFAADLNGDGHPDIVSGNGGSDNVSVLINKGDGRFKAPVNYPVKLPQGVAVADLNGDGYPDIATANQSANSSSVLLNNGDGTFAPSFDVNVRGLYPTGIVLADVNGDGRRDLVTANSGSHEISILLNGVSPPHVQQVTPPLGSTVTTTDGRLSSPIEVQMSVAVKDGTIGARDVQMVGSQSGPHPVDVHVADRVIQLRPSATDWRFLPGEEVTIQLARSLRSAAGLPMQKGFSSSFFVQAAAASAHFVERGRHALDSRVTSIGAADLDGDGRLDLVAVPRDGGVVSVYLNGASLFSAPVSVSTGAHAISDFLLADVDGDGNTDLAVFDEMVPQMLVAFGDGSGRFSAQASFALPEVPRSVAVRDLDGDGLPDIAALGRQPEIAVLFNAGARRFKPATGVALESGGAVVRALDVTNDGIVDLLVLSDRGDAVTAYQGKGDGTFLKKDSVALGKSGATALLVRDVNQDGSPDFVAVNGTTGVATLWTNNGAGTFRVGRSVLFTSEVVTIAVHDVDGDGAPDLVASTLSGIAVALNRGRGAFGTPMLSRAGRSTTMAVGDFNGDGMPDVVALADNGASLVLAVNGSAGRAVDGPSSRNRP
jgi:hypothetical protein